MSKIEKALKKAQKEAEKRAKLTPEPKKHKQVDSSGQGTSDKKAAQHESRIMSAMEKDKHENKSALDLNVRAGSVPGEDAVPSVKGTGCGGQNNEESFPSTTIDTYNVDEHIVSYYCAINKQTWQGPVMVYFRRLQLSLANLQKNNGCKVVLFTSSSMNEGKTTIAANIAITLCSDQKSRVALVDCDFRKPSLGSMLGFGAEKGLADYLSEGVGIEDIALDGLVPGLTIIPAGSKQTHIYELLDSDRMKEFVSSLKKQFDYVIIDSPPVLAFPDTTILASMVDGVALVVNRKGVKKKHAKQAAETLKGCNIVGFVMNMSKVSTTDYYGYSYGK